MKQRRGCTAGLGGSWDRGKPLEVTTGDTGGSDRERASTSPLQPLSRPCGSAGGAGGDGRG